MLFWGVGCKIKILKCACYGAFKANKKQTIFIENAYRSASIPLVATKEHLL